MHVALPEHFIESGASLKNWQLVIGAVVEQSSRDFLIRPTPLFEEEADTLLSTLLEEMLNPSLLDRPCPIPVGKIPGVGKVTEARMAGVGIKTVGDIYEMISLLSKATLEVEAHGCSNWRVALTTIQ